MSRTIRSLVLAAFLACPAFAAGQVHIPPACCVPNRPPGRCGWCALETLARHHHLKALYGLADRHDYRACAGDLEDALQAAHVRYRIQYAGDDDTAILRYAVRHQLGAVVGFAELEPGAGKHIVTLVDFGPEKVRVIDPNDRDGRVRTMSRDRFLYWWDGFALVPECKRPDAHAHHAAKAANAPLAPDLEGQ